MRRDSPASGRCPLFTEDHEAFRELARDFVEKEVVRAYPEWEKGGRMPLNFVVTDIQPAPANLAGTTLATTGTFHQRSAPGPIVLIDQGGHWLITHDTAMTALDAFWYYANRHFPVYVPHI
jgi:hypothetical protein